MLQLDWQPRDQPLEPQAALALDDGALTGLHNALSALPAARRSRLRRVEGPAAALLVLGANADLPWCDGLHWFGVDPQAPALLLPTRHAPTPPLELLQRACARRAPGGRRWLLSPAVLWALQS